MVTDFIQGAFANLVFVALIVYLLGFVFRWDQIAEVLLAAPAGKSPIHPMDMSGQQDFDLTYFLIAVAIVFYTFNSWQGTSGYNCCAKDAHEAKMAGLLYGWRFRVLLTVTIVVPIAVMTLVSHPDFAGQAAELQRSLDGIEAPTAEQRATLQGQLRIPYALALLLPPGLLGLVVAAMLAAFISTHDTYLHSWGSIFVQDVVLPFRKRPLSPGRTCGCCDFPSLAWRCSSSSSASSSSRPSSSRCSSPSRGPSSWGARARRSSGGCTGSAARPTGAWAAMITGMLLSAVGIVIKQIDPARVERLAGGFPGSASPRSTSRTS